MYTHIYRERERERHISKSWRFIIREREREGGERGGKENYAVFCDRIIHDI